MATASRIDSTAPSTSGVENSRLMPSMMNWPRLLSSIRLVTVTRPMVVTVAIRSPATMTGMARGSSTLQDLLGENPDPIASLTSGGTPSRPATMLRMRMSSV